jgi:hypothetical protein
MTEHCKIYLVCFGYGEQDFMACEVCGSKAVDVHHIHGRGKGKDTIQNLMALCRLCHLKAHGGTKTYLHPDMLQVIYNDFMAVNNGC